VAASWQLHSQLLPNGAQLNPSPRPQSLATNHSSVPRAVAVADGHPIRVSPAYRRGRGTGIGVSLLPVDLLFAVSGVWDEPAFSLPFSLFLFNFLMALEGVSCEGAERDDVGVDTGIVPEDIAGAAVRM